MTADIELLPLPAHFAHQHDNVKNLVRGYARANVISHTEAMAAENEMLKEWEWKKPAEQAEDRLGDIIHQASNTSNGVRIVLRQHTKGFSRTILRNVRTKENPMWRTLEHQEYRLEIDSGESDG